MRSTKYNVHGWVSVNGNDVCTCFGPKRRFFPAHTQAVPFAYEMHSGDENVKEGATHSATHYNAEMRESFQRSAPHPWALATWKLKLAKCDAGQLSIPRQSYLECCEHKRSFNFDRLGLPNASERPYCIAFGDCQQQKVYTNVKNCHRLYESSKSECT